MVAKATVKFDARIVMWAVIAPATRDYCSDLGLRRGVLWSFNSVAACVAIEAVFLLCRTRSKAAVADGSVWVAGLLMHSPCPRHRDVGVNCRGCFCRFGR